MLQTYDQTQNEQIIKNCLVYARVSTDRQVQTGHSLDDQVDRLVKFARNKGWHVLDVYKDGGKSGGSIAGRPEFTRMLEKCEKDSTVDAVLVEETDRYSRSVQDHLAVKSFLQKHNVQLVTTQQVNFEDDPAGRFMDLVLAGANQLQREITGEKTRRTMIALAEKGFQPGPAVMGYLNSYQKGKPWKVDKEKAYFIKEAFRLHHTGNYSVYQIEEELYNQGFRNKNGNKVWASAIHRILTDVRYAGRVKYAGKTYDGKHPSIVSLEDIKKSEAIMNKRNKGADRSRKHNWFLAGMAHCKKCGSLMTGELHVKATGQSFRYYRCLGPKTRGLECKQPYARMNTIHNQLKDLMVAIKFDKKFFKELRAELEDVMKSQNGSTPKRLKALKDRKKVIENKMEVLEDQIIAKTIPKSRIDKKYVPLRDELETVESQIEKLSRPSANLDKKKIDTIIKFVKRLPDLYESFNKTQRKQFLKWFVEKIWIKDKKIVEVTYKESFQALVDLDLVRIRTLWLRLVDMFSNREIEFGFSLQNIQTVFETFNLPTLEYTS